ncbi:putative alpha/Beta hydrolase [Septoria linicola]|nr:putative alpha/Beta hydrolase [Septoria linicola]
MSAVTEPQKIPTRGRALADISYNSLLADNGTSSEDESPGLDLEPGNDARGAIGVSIGREQTRLLSPRTPAVEKAAALQSGGYFGGAFDSDTPAVAESPDEIDVLDGKKDSHSPSIEPRARRPSLRPPSPWKTGPRSSDKPSLTKSILRDGFSFGRRRASSGPESGSRSFFSAFPSMPKNFSFGPSFLTGSDSKGDDKVTRRRSFSKRRSTLISQSLVKTPASEERGTITSTGQNTPPATAAASRPDFDEDQAKIGELPSDFHLRHVRTRPAALLRRSTSDTSLVTQRTLSTVSSLGDDSRFEHVSEQVNSRFKAIKDSLQDSRINMPSMPSISSFHVSNFTPDFFSRERSNSSFTKSNPRTSSFQHAKSSAKPVDPMTRQPYTSARAAIADSGLDKFAASHPHFHHALEQLEGDVVVLGGYRGSILRSAEPPHRQLWVPIKVGLNLRKVDLELGLEDADAEERASEKVIAGGMLTHIGPVDISRRLFKRLRTCNNARNGWLRVHDYGYDWRLHPSYLSRQLIKFLEGLECNQPGVPKELRGATVIAHSLGGLITRHAVNQRPELFRGVVYAGVPHTCVNILGPLRNGDEVLLSSRVLTAQVNFTIRTSFALLPLDGRCFVDKKTKEEYPVDFFDPQTWIDGRLSPCVDRPLPPLSGTPKPTGIAGYMNTVANALPSFPSSARKNSKSSTDLTKATNAGGAAAPDTMNTGIQGSDVAIATGNINNSGQQQGNNDFDDIPAARTAVTISRDDAIAYLTRTLATVKRFKEELAFNPGHDTANAYPPISVIYGKSTPTVVGAKVDGKDGIKHADCYDELAFASGDGVVLAKAAMAPEGYRTARGGIVSSERGHVTLLGDLEAVGRCLNAVIQARRKGVGMR